MSGVKHLSVLMVTKHRFTGNDDNKLEMFSIISYRGTLISHHLPDPPFAK